MATKWASGSAAGGGDGTEGNPYTIAELQSAAANGDTLVMFGNFDASSLTLSSLTGITVISGHLVNPAKAQGKLRNRLTANSANWKNTTGTSYANYIAASGSPPWKVCVDWDTTSADAYGFRNCNLQRQSSVALTDAGTNSFTTAARTVNASSVATGNPAQITFSANHGFTTGQTVTLAGFNTSATINGARVVTVVDATRVTVPVNVTSVTTGTGTATTTAGDELYINIGSDPSAVVVNYAVSRAGFSFSSCADPVVLGMAFEWCGNDNGNPVLYGVTFIDCTGVPQVCGCTFTENGYHCVGFYSTSGTVAGRDVGNTFIGCQNDSCSVAYSGNNTVANVLFFGNTYYCSTPLKRGASTTPIFNQSASGSQNAPGVTAHQSSSTGTGVTDVKIVNCRFICPPYTRTGSAIGNAVSPIICRNNPAPSNTADPNTYAVKIVNCTFTGFDSLNPLFPYAHAYIGCQLDFGGSPYLIAGGNGVGLVGRALGGGSNTNAYIGSFGTQWGFNLDTTSGNNMGGAFFVNGGNTTANRTFYYFDHSTVYNYGVNSSTSQHQSFFRWSSSVNVAGNGKIVARDSIFAHRVSTASARYMIYGDSDADIAASDRDFKRCVYGNVATGLWSDNSSYNAASEWAASIDTEAQQYSAAIIEPVGGSGTLVLGSAYRNAPKYSGPSSTKLGSNGYPTSLTPGSVQFNGCPARSRGYARSDRTGR